MISAKLKIKILWTLFILTVLIPLVGFAGLSFKLLNIIQYILPLILLFLHSFWIFGLKNSAILLIPPFIIGFLFEIIGVNYGVIFGGHYFYNSQSLGPLIFKVPILIPFFWSFFVYTGYIITSSFLTWLKTEKPSKNNKKFWLLALLIIIDGLIVVAVDFFMDPIMVAGHNWAWITSGSYFNIPLGNFFGWFLVTMISTGIFRSYEYFFPVPKSSLPETLFLIPVVGYAMLTLMFAILALSLKLNNLAVIGVLIMLPVTLINLYLCYEASK